MLRLLRVSATALAVAGFVFVGMQPAEENSVEALAPETEPASEPEEAAEATETVEAPSHDATVVIEVLPPEDVAAADQPEAEASDDNEPIETAAITPPSDPAPVADDKGTRGWADDPQL